MVMPLIIPIKVGGAHFTAAKLEVGVEPKSVPTLFAVKKVSKWLSLI